VACGACPELVEGSKVEPSKGYWFGSSYRKPKGKQKSHPELDYPEQ
jgi:hypothetical protein